MSSLTAVIITLNEERNIERCIRSLLPVADEVLVVDSFSRDKTAEICKKFGAKVILQEWLGFGLSKNLGNRNASHDWILSLDADEELSAELQQSILSEKKNLNGIYSFKRLNNYCGKWIRHSGWYPDIKERIFNRNEVLWSENLIHEKLISPEGINKHLLKGDCLHFSYISETDLLIKTKKYARLSAEEMNQKNLFVFPGGLYVKTFFRFIKGFVLQGGIWDGKPGWDICRMGAYGVYLKYKYYAEMRGEKSGKMEDGSWKQKNKSLSDIIK